MARAEALNDVVDGVLAERAAAGDNRAFAELYRRHAEVAWRVGYAVTGNREDAADAVSEAFTRVLQALPQGRLRESNSFRAYLLTATRRVGIDCLRRRGRSEAGDVSGYAATTTAGPSDRVVDATDAALVSAAFRTLPERWRSVLWLTEVEQIPAKDAAPLLGLSPNGVAQLAVRARNGLRERYLQAHLRDGEVPESCRFTVEHLGAYVAGALAPRDLAKVDQHLAGCEPCRQREAELEELGERLRKIVLPIPIGLGALALKHWRGAGGFSLAGKVRKLPELAGRAERPLAVASAVLFAMGMAGMVMVHPAQPGAGQAAAPKASAPSADAASRAGAVDFTTAASVGAAPAEDPSAERRQQAFGNLSGDTVPGGADLSNDEVPIDDVIVIDNGNSGTPTPPPPPAHTTKPTAQLQVTVSSGGQSAALAAGQGDGSCTGGALGGQGAGCTPSAPNSDSVITASTGGTAVPDPAQQTIHIP